jgi:quercetin dioxygenase-like cupin family protein
MQKIRLKEMTPSKIDGERGLAYVYDPLPDDISAGVRVVERSSDVPKKPHFHPEKQIIYVIAGSGRITNGEITFDLGPGDFVTLESNEAHYVTTEDEELTVFEVKYSV